jgi:cardiolipin synthase
MAKMNDKRKPEVKKEDFFTIPNILTYVRFMLIPVFVTFYLIGFNRNESMNRVYEWIGIGAVILASLTDFVDGKIARHYNMTTELGKIIDPLADKMMQLAIAIVVCFVFYYLTNTFYMVWILGIFVFKEITQFILIYVAYSRGSPLKGAQWYGKVATFGFDVLTISLLIVPLFAQHPNESAIIILAAVVGILLIFSWAMYTFDSLKFILQNKKK